MNEEKRKIENRELLRSNQVNDKNECEQRHDDDDDANHEEEEEEEEEKEKEEKAKEGETRGQKLVLRPDILFPLLTKRKEREIARAVKDKEKGKGRRKRGIFFLLFLAASLLFSFSGLILFLLLFHALFPPFSVPFPSVMDLVDSVDAGDPFFQLQQQETDYHNHQHDRKPWPCPATQVQEQ